MSVKQCNSFYLNRLQYYAFFYFMQKALHWLDPDFKRVTFSPEVKESVKDIGFKDPAIAQSMCD